MHYTPKDLANAQNVLAGFCQEWLFRLNRAAGADIQTGMGVYKGTKHMGTGLQQDAGGCNSESQAEARESPHCLWVFVPAKSWEFTFERLCCQFAR